MKLKLQQAAAVGIDADFYAHGVIGQDVFYQFGPLQETEVAAVEVVFVAHVIDFLDAADAVEVKVVDGVAMPVGVFIDEGEGGRGDDVVYAQFLAQCLDEGGLAGAHAAIECDDAGFADAVDKLLCRCAYGVERLYSDLCHIVLSFLGFQCDEGDEHLFHRDAAVLERVLVIRHVVIVVVGVGEEAVAGRKHIAGAQIGHRQLGLLGVANDKHVLGVVTEVLAQLVAQIGVGVAVAHYLDGVGAAYGAVVGGHHHAVSGGGE